ncbi:MAG: FtsX-like permease family protein [Bacteroidota bacterium]
MIPNPPQIALKFLRWFCREDYVEEVEGDLIEVYEHQYEKSHKKAKVKFCWSVLRYFRPEFIKSFKTNQSLSSIAMFRSNLKITFRVLSKSKLMTSINIFSLTIGIAACIAIYLFIEDESSFDHQHTKKENIYRLNEIQNFTGTKEQKVALSMPGMGPAMLNDFPEVLSFTRFWPSGKRLFSKDETRHTIDKFYTVDSTFLRLFNFPLIAGSSGSALDEPNSIVLTEETALKFFSNAEKALGNSISMGEEVYKVTAVLENVPENSHLQFNALRSMSTITMENPDFNDQWGSNFLNTYLFLASDVDIAKLESKFDDFMIRHTEDPEITNFYELYLQPLNEVHLGSADVEHDYNNYRKFDGKYLSTFSLVGVFILVIASINFMNLSTARASQRWKEIGVRKAIGAQKIQLFNQFILESIMLAFVAMILAFFIDLIALPLLSNLIGRELSLFYFIQNPQYLALVFTITLALGLLAGLYPSLYMTAFKAVNVLKANNKQGSNKSVLRSGLVILQFGLALAMIVSTLIVLQQLNFMKNKDIGFDKDQIILVDMNGEANDKFEVMKKELLDLSSVSGVTASGQRIGNNFHQWGFKVKTDTGIYNMTPSNVLVEYDYLDVYNIKLRVGRTFSKDFATDDGLAYIINETLAKELALGENAVGTPAAHSWYPDDSLGTIIGVTEDFNFNSLHHKVNTLSMVVHSEWNFDEMSVKIKSENIKEVVAQIENIWNRHIDEWPFDYSFLDEHFAELYSSDNQMSAVVGIMTVLAILIACMGLFGLSSIMVVQKVKEVGIRKTLGASTFQITYLLSKNFLLLVIIAFVIVSPVTYVLLKDWLQNFAFHVNINLTIFILGAIISLLIALLTISFHTVKASQRNPVDALRYQ